MNKKFIIIKKILIINKKFMNFIIFIMKSKYS